MKLQSVLLNILILIFILITYDHINPVKSPASNNNALKVVSLDAEKLPKVYDGDNRRIVEILKASYFQKSEFETREDYAKRSEDSANKLYAFSYIPRRFAEYGGSLEKELSYVIEASSFKINLSRIKIIEKSWDEVKGSYVGQNAFGAKASITKGTRNRYFIHLPEEDFITDLPMATAKAKIAAENIRILYWVRIRDVKCEKHTISPTFDSLFDGEYKGCECRTIPLEMWIYNFKTGEIYKKVKFESNQSQFKWEE